MIVPGPNSSSDWLVWSCKDQEATVDAVGCAAAQPNSSESPSFINLLQEVELSVEDE